MPDLAVDFALSLAVADGLWESHCFACSPDSAGVCALTADFLTFPGKNGGRGGIRTHIFRVFDVFNVAHICLSVR
jgi:hypothetical protein